MILSKIAEWIDMARSTEHMMWMDIPTLCWSEGGYLFEVFGLNIRSECSAKSDILRQPVASPPE